MSLDSCPNCNRKLSTSMLHKNELLSDKQVHLIKLFPGNNMAKDAYCSKCGIELLKVAIKEWNEEMNILSTAIRHLLPAIPIVSTHSPMHWNYDVLEVVTGQSVLGTNAWMEFTTDWGDFFGYNSKKHANKIKQGEAICFEQLRRKALDLGGNAIIATDIDYAEVGGPKNMLMVCMTGTVVRLRNPDILGEDKFIKLDKIKRFEQRIVDLVNYSDLSV